MFNNNNTTKNNIHAANGCSRLDWMKCAGVAHSAECATECDDGLTSPACISFLGQSYVQCGSCLSTVEKIKAAGKDDHIYTLYLLEVDYSKTAIASTKLWYGRNDPELAPH